MCLKNKLTTSRQKNEARRKTKIFKKKYSIQNITLKTAQHAHTMPMKNKGDIRGSRGKENGIVLMTIGTHSSLYVKKIFHICINYITQ